MATSVLSLAALISTANLADGQQVKSDEHNTGRRNWEQRMNKLLGAATDMQENYAGASQPNERRDGSIWYDETNTVFQARKSSAWVEMMDLTDGYAQSLSTAGTETFKPGGAIDVNTTQASGAGDLMSYTVPGNTLNEDNAVLAVSTFGTYAGAVPNANTSYGSDTSASPQSGQTSGATDFFMRAIVIRTGAASQKMFSFSKLNRDDGGFETLVQLDNFTQSNSINNVFKLTREGGTVTQEIMLTRYLP